MKSLYENAGAHTVQQHFKRVFETGVRSRRDLVGKVFFTDCDETRSRRPGISTR